VEVSALKYSGGIGLHGRSPLLRLQSDDRLIALMRRGNPSAFEVLVGRYEVRLLAFCRHLLGSREDAEDVLQEVMTAAFNAILADERAINVRPWLYRIARNRSLNHLRRISAIGVDTMDHHLSEHGASTADKVDEREEFRLLVGDIQELPETQRTALVLREMDALSYDQISEAMETTVPSVKSLLVRARISLAEAAEARLLSCEEVRFELAEVSEGLLRKASPLVRRHLKDCKRCTVFQVQLRQTNKALAALLPIGPLVLLKRFAIFHIGHSAGSSATAAGSGATAAGSGATAGAGATAAGAGATAAGATAAGAGAVAGAGAMAGSGSLLSAGVGAVAGKAAAGLAAAALVAAAGVEANHHAAHHHPASTPTIAASVPQSTSPTPGPNAPGGQGASGGTLARSRARRPLKHGKRAKAKIAKTQPTTTKTATTTTTTPTTATSRTRTTSTSTTPTETRPKRATRPGRTQAQQDPTVLPPTTTSPAPPAPPIAAPTTTTTTSTFPATTTTTTTATTITTAPTTTTIVIRPSTTSSTQTDP